MGIDCTLKQCSQLLLEKFEEEPELMEIFISSLPSSELSSLGYIIPFNNEPEEIKSDIDLAIAEARNEELDIGKQWHSLHFLLTKDSSSWEEAHLPFLVQENNDGCPLVNLLMGGTPFEKYDTSYSPVRYLTSSQVKNVTSALSSITEECLRMRYSQAFVFSHDIYHPAWEADDLEDFMDIFEEVLRYCKDAASKNNAMFIYLT